MAPDVAVIVPAAGQGRRLGSRQAKVLVPVAGKPLVLHALRAFHASPSVGWIILVARPQDQRRLAALVRRHHLTKVSAIVPGAASRSGSVANGLAALPPQARWVVIHDGARPCVTRALVESVVRQAKRHGAVACGLPASLTVKAVDENHTVRLTLDRDHLWFVQTPQAFRRAWLEEAVVQANGTLDRFPDDAALVEQMGVTVRMIPGDPLNIKVTTKEDVLLAEAILRMRGWKYEVGSKK